MAYRVDTVKGGVDGCRVAHVTHDELGVPGKEVGPAVVHGGGKGVEAAYLVARVPESLHDMRPDEAGRPCD
jgi:hypothetical protein